LTLYREARSPVSGYALVDRGAGKVMVVALWHNEKDAPAANESGAMAQDLRSLDEVLAAAPQAEAYRVEGYTAMTGQPAYARVTIADVRAQRRLEASGIRDRALPAYQRVEGFCGACLLIALHSAEGMVITLWASAEDAQAHAQSGARTEVLSRFSGVMAGPSQLAPPVEGFDGALHIHQKDAHHSSRGRRR
jgi:heme-degrading monooxygenase HmoA